MSASTAASTSAVFYCPYANMPIQYPIGFRIHINRYHVLTIYYDLHCRHTMFVESTQLNRREVISHYETPIQTIRYLYRCSAYNLPTLDAVYCLSLINDVAHPFTQILENTSWYELFATCGALDIYLENPIFARVEPVTPPRAAAPIVPPMAPLRVQNTNVPRALNDELTCHVKRTFTFTEDQEDQEDEPIDFLELRSGAKIPRYTYHK